MNNTIDGVNPNMSTPKVSIIIPVYNVEKYLCQCLDSAKNQTVTDVEIICIDDGSTDNSGTILDEYASQDKRFIVIHQPNAGQSVARNKGIDISSGQYVTFLDSDDWLEPTMVENVIKAFSDFSGEIIAYDYHVINESQLHFENPKSININFCSTIEDRIRCVQSFKNVIWNMAYRKDFLNKNRLRFPIGINYEDVYFSTMCACLSSQIRIEKKAIYNYRIGSGYSTNALAQNKRISYIDLYDILLKELRKHTLPNTIIDYYIAQRFSVMRSLYRRYCNPVDRPMIRDKILDSLTQADWQYLQRTNPFLSARKRAFYFWLKGEYLQSVTVLLQFLFKRTKKHL